MPVNARYTRSYISDVRILLSLALMRCVPFAVKSDEQIGQNFFSTQKFSKLLRGKTNGAVPHSAFRDSATDLNLEYLILYILL